MQTLLLTRRGVAARLFFIGAMTGSLLLPKAAVAKDEPRYFHGVFRQFLEEYAAAGLPEVFPDQLAVVGLVKRPGLLPGETITLTKAIEAAGGFADFADRRRLGIWKNGEGRFVVVDERAIENHENDKPDPVLDKGDVIVVISRRMGF